MKRNGLFVILAAFLLFLPASAQKKKSSGRRSVPAPVVELSKEELRFQEMLGATQQIMFIDSMVVDKQDFLASYMLTSDAGTINNYNKFFNSEEQPYSTVYVNQLGNKCWFANNGSLYTIDKLNNQWSEPAPLEGLGQFQRTNYPFMLSDGLTLYFAAIGDEGLGGLDIYMSRYDSESEKFLLAENIGLPFNSDANDYMYAIDEFNNIGFFASDRRQPEGKVCIYTFIPNKKRITYSPDEYDENVIKSRARIESIADTWNDEVRRNDALNRLNSIEKSMAKSKQEDFWFVVNDDIVYTSFSDFRSNENRERMKQLESLRKKYDDLSKEIDKARIYYSTKASNAEKNGLRAELLSYEQEYYQMETEIRQLEKVIRSSELNAIK